MTALGGYMLLKEPLIYVQSTFVLEVQETLSLKLPITTISSALSSVCDFKSLFCKQCRPRSDCSSRSSLIWVYTVCLYEKNRFERFAKIFSRRHKQTTFSDVGFLGVLRVNSLDYFT